jgi:hypothetical protein
VITWRKRRRRRKRGGEKTHELERTGVRVRGEGGSKTTGRGGMDIGETERGDTDKHETFYSSHLVSIQAIEMPIERQRNVIMGRTHFLAPGGNNSFRGASRISTKNLVRKRPIAAPTGIDVYECRSV